jgi:hypothetical protein
LSALEPQLKEIVELWPLLSPEAREAVLRIVQAYVPREDT